MADTAVCARDADALTRLKSPMDYQRLPCAEARHWQRGRLDMAQRTRFWPEGLRGHERVFGRRAVAVERYERDDVIASGEPIRVLDNDTRQLIGRDRRQPVAGPLQLATCDRSSMDTDQHLSRTGARLLDLLQLEVLDLTRRVQTNGSHSKPSLIHQRRHMHRPRQLLKFPTNASISVGSSAVAYRKLRIGRKFGQPYEGSPTRSRPATAGRTRRWL